MKDEKFEYTYTAPTQEERREIESIRRQYQSAGKKDDKLERLRRLNRRVHLPPVVYSVLLGVAGTLIMGAGMSLSLVWNLLFCGIPIGLAGIAIAACAHPLYKFLLKRGKRRYGQEILDLSGELLNDQEKS